MVFMLEAILPVIFKMHPKFVIFANFHVLRWIKGEFNPKATDRGPLGPRIRLTTDYFCVDYL